ncbi:F-box/LRR-repeat protein At2g42730, partial [Linum grandiflorum]
DKILTLPEAIRTSVLSTKWTNLWKASVSVLDFDASEELQAILQKPPFGVVPEQRRRFMNWVDGVVSQMQRSSSCSKLSKFRLRFDFTNESNSKGDIDRWVKFAISKRVESLHLDLHGHFSTALVFSEELYNHIKTPAGMRDIKFLRSLRLSYVEVGGEILAHFIANCPVLEELAVKCSDLLKKLKVVGSNSLKCLEVRFCHLLESVEIDHAPRLVRFVFGGSSTVTELHVRNCPSLVEVVRFRGRKLDSEFMDYVMEYFVGLETIIVDCSSTFFLTDDHTRYPMSACSEEQLGEARKRASELKSRAPAGIEFRVI